MRKVRVHWHGTLCLHKVSCMRGEIEMVQLNNSSVKHFLSSQKNKHIESNHSDIIAISL